LDGCLQVAPLIRWSRLLAWHTWITGFGDGRPVSVTVAEATPAGRRMRIPLSVSSEADRWTSLTFRVRLVPCTADPPGGGGPGAVAAGADVPELEVLLPPPPHAVSRATTASTAKARCRRTARRLCPLTLGAGQAQRGAEEAEGPLLGQRAGVAEHDGHAG